MDYSKFRFTLDIHKHQSQVSVPVMRGDTAVQLYIALSDGGLPYKIGESCFAIVIGNKPDGGTFRHPCIIEGGGTIIRYDFQPDTSELSGAILTEVRLYGTNGILTAPCFTIVVDERIPHYDETVPADAITALDQVFLNEAVRVAAENERAKADKARWEYFASLYYPALDGIIALQDGLIGMHALYKLNEDGESYTCIGGLNIEEIVIADMVNDKPVTAIAPYAFKNYDKLRIITIPENIRTIGTAAFEGCTALETIYFNAVNMSDCTNTTMAFKYCGMNTKNGTALVIGKKVTQIPSYLFYGWTENDESIYNLTSLSFENGAVCTTINQRAFYACFSLKHIEIADSVKTLSYHSLRKCGTEEIIFGENSQLVFIDGSALYGTKLKRITIPKTVNQINSSAFANSADLKSVTFLGKPSTINATAFNNSTNVEFTVPWAEGEVANAPWGATNATIHYNSEV